LQYQIADRINTGTMPYHFSCHTEENMQDMITGKEIIGLPVRVPLFKGKKNGETTQRNSSGYLTTSYYKITSQHEVVIDEKTYLKAKKRTIFSRFGCLLYLLTVALTVGLPLVLFSFDKSWANILAVIVFAIGVIWAITLVILARGYRATAEQMLAKWYAENEPMEENEGFFTLEEMKKNNIK